MSYIYQSKPMVSSVAVAREQANDWTATIFKLNRWRKYHRNDGIEGRVEMSPAHSARVSGFRESFLEGNSGIFALFIRCIPSG